MLPAGPYERPRSGNDETARPERARAKASISWLLAAAIGVPAAYGFVTLISQVLLPIPFNFSPLTLLVTLVFILLCATLAGVIPAISAARVRTADILRYE